MASHRAPKQWCLSKSETVNSFETWWNNLTYHLSLDPNFNEFLNTTWKSKKEDVNRGFQDDPETVKEDKRLTATQKVVALDLMLGQIANYCPIISRNTFLKKCNSLKHIYQTIRQHFGFQTSGAQFIDFTHIKLEPDERYEDLYQRIVAFVEDSLLTSDSDILHNGLKVKEDEELSPTLENFITLTWLQLIHKDLPQLVKQRYGTELRSKTLASIKPEISQALNSLVAELTSYESSVFRTFTSYKDKDNKQHSRKRKQCPICKLTNRPDKHYLSECPYLPEADKKYVKRAHSRQVDIAEDTSCEEDSDPDDEGKHDKRNSFKRVSIRQSPYIDTLCNGRNVRVTIDSGATGSLVRSDIAKALKLPISKTNQYASQADGTSSLCVIGETHFTLLMDNINLSFEGLVVTNLDVDILGGMPFMEDNDISIRPAKKEIKFGGNKIYTYSNPPPTLSRHQVRRAAIIRAPNHPTTIWPGEELEVSAPPDNNDYYFLEPITSTSKARRVEVMWPNHIVTQKINGKIKIPNNTLIPQTIIQNEHLCQAIPLVTPESLDITLHVPSDDIQVYTTQISRQPIVESYSKSIAIDPDNILPANIQKQFHALHERYDEVFNPMFNGYNGKAGPFKAVVNMGPVKPPQRKGRVPQYARKNLEELQTKFDELLQLGVFKRPEEIDVVAEYINPSFLVTKKNGISKRLVTAFADVGRYCKPQPALMPDVDSTLQHIAKWKYIICTDLSNAFYQIPLSDNSIKYCGVATPFKGTLVYVRSAMGMPGSETALEELMCRILGDLLTEGIVTKLADDLYCGADTPEDLLENWERVLSALQKCSMNLSPKKTIVAPKTTTILGWSWEGGSISASPHRISTLSTCLHPEKVKGMRSFIGAFKVLSRVLPNCSSYITPLEKAISGAQSTDTIKWTEELKEHFETAQHSLHNNRKITLPKPSDLIWIITDGSVKQQGIGSTMYVRRADKLLLAGFFSAKLRDRQVTWLPCEVEALSIAASIKHFSPYIIQSHHKACLLTDSKPCVQAFEKLCRGEFSASPRVTTFLSTASRYQVSVRHIQGISNLPSDFASRNAKPCDEQSCQICSFIAETEDSVVRAVKLDDILRGDAKLPYSNRATWLEIQADCPDLRRTRAHLLQGTRPSKKLTKIRDVKRYLNVATLAKDGLLVVPRTEPLNSSQDRIIIPRQVVDGLLTSLHIQLDHPSSHQLKCVVQRYFFALDLDKSISIVTQNCHLCEALKNTPAHLTTQSSEDPPDVVGISFSADVMRRCRQIIMVVRECVTSYTTSCLLKSETHDDLRDSLIKLCLPLVPIDGPPAVIRTDSAPGFRALTSDALLKSSRIIIDLGRTKNVNKNPVGERAIQEMELEILKQSPGGGMITQNTLAFATARLNTRIRCSGLSSREMLYQRDQYNNEQLPVVDRTLILEKHSKRLCNHKSSEITKAGGKPPLKKALCDVGDLVYLYQDGNKNKARDRYLVVSVDPNFYSVKKFTGAQLRKSSYRIKHDECYKVPGTMKTLPNHANARLEVDEVDGDVTPQDIFQHSLPTIPSEISEPQMITPQSSELLNTPIPNDSECRSYEPNDNYVVNESPTDLHHEKDSIVSESSKVSECSSVPNYPETTNPISITSDSTELRRSKRTSKPPDRYGCPIMY